MLDSRFPRVREDGNDALLFLLVPGDVFPQVAPARIGFLDQLDFPCPVPFLQLFFPRDRRVHIPVHLEVDQLMDLIFLGKSLDQIVFVFPDSPD